MVIDADIKMEAETMDNNTFLDFVQKIEERLKTMSEQQNDRFTRKTSPTEFERLVIEASKAVIDEEQYDCVIDYTEGGHIFPDIIYTFDNEVKFGIEVKSSTNENVPSDSWSILGNSILGSTRVDVEDLYIVFIKVNKKGCFVKSARYEDSVSDVVVTHSPRYKINLGQNPEESFFSKSGISYSSIKSSKDPIGLVTDYFRRQGHTAWWIAESTPAIIRIWEELNSDERKEILATAFILFPELISSTGSRKYKRLTKWLVANFSIVDSSLRDKFSAGGKVDLIIDGVCFDKMPRVMENLFLHSEEIRTKLNEVSLDEIQLYWDAYIPESDTLGERMNYWYSSISGELSADDKDKQLAFLYKLFPEISRP